MGIAENPRDGRTRAEPGKAIRIPQPARASGSWHAAIIADSRAAAATFPTAARAGFLTLRPLFSPTHFHEEPKEEMQHALRTDAPIYGRVYAQFVHASPATFEWRSLLRPLAEMEYAAKLGSDLPPRAQPYRQEEVAEAVASLHPGMEIAECRFAQDESFPPLPAILADGSGSGSIVCGPAIPEWRTRDVAGQEAALRVNGVERRRGTARAAVDHPLVSLTWLANELSRTGVGMKAGEMVSTGTLTGMVVARAGEEHVADYGPFGEVHVRFAA